MVYVNLDDVLVDLKLPPSVLEVPVPRFFIEDYKRALEEREKLLDVLLIQAGITDQRKGMRDPREVPADEPYPPPRSPPHSFPLRWWEIIICCSLPAPRSATSPILPTPLLIGQHKLHLIACLPFLLLPLPPSAPSETSSSLPHRT